jgi:hypothetical protein
MGMVNGVVLLLDLAITATVVGCCRRKSVLTQEETMPEISRRAYEGLPTLSGFAEDRTAMWTTGVGTLLWSLEGRLSRPSGL